MMNKNQSVIRQYFLSPTIKRALWQVMSLSFVINLLLLTSPLYMLQMYDRVLTSRSEETLISLSAIALFLLMSFGFLEVLRAKIMVLVSTEVDDYFNNLIFKGLFREVLQQGDGIGSQPIRDLESMRAMIASHSLLAIFDLPWTPFFIALIFCMHPLLGVVALCGGIATIVLTIISERTARPLLTTASAHQMAASRFVDSCLKNADVIHALGMLEHIRERWLASYLKSVEAGAETAHTISGFSGTTKAFRMILQSAMLGFGGWLALSGDVSAGVMVAASIIVGRVLAPLEQVVAASKGFLATWAAVKRLDVLLNKQMNVQQPMSLPRPIGKLTVDDVTIILPHSKKPLLQNISFSLNAGEVLVIVGPSASGKSTLARALLGLIRPVKGTIRLDGAELAQWNMADLGAFIGFLPQDVELLAGTVKENIARFSEVDANAVVAAANQANCHQMILNLSEGYETRIGERNNQLSGGQSQRVALARCLYGKPVLSILDEPDANLDIEGMAALEQSIVQMKNNGSTVILITHNVRLLRHADKAMLLANGNIAFLGHPNELMDRLNPRKKA